MSDWGRDYYRRVILNELKILASPEKGGCSVYADTEIFSSRDSLSPSVYSNLERLTHDAYPPLDAELGHIRYASSVTSVTSYLFVTRDNIDTYLEYLSMGGPIEAIRFILETLWYYRNSVLTLTMHQLDTIENLWSEHLQVDLPFDCQSQRFHTFHCLSFCLCPRLNQRRTLSMIAIAEDAWDWMINISGLNAEDYDFTKQAFDSTRSLEVSTVFMNGLSELKNVSARHNLLASTQRVQGLIDYSVDQKLSKPWFLNCDSFIIELLALLHIVPYGNPFYLQTRFGFIRSSSCIDRQEIGLSPSGPLPVNDHGKIFHKELIIIHGEAEPHDEDIGGMCVFLFSDSLEGCNRNKLQTMVNKYLQSDEILHCILRSRSIWNEGLCFQFLSNGRIIERLVNI